jgi:hypothetical protein
MTLLISDRAQLYLIYRKINYPGGLILHVISYNNTLKSLSDILENSGQNIERAHESLADEAKKSGGFQQAFGPLGDILDVGSSGQKITQEEENRVSPSTH